MKICNETHEEIVYKNESCPLCNFEKIILDQKEIIKQQEETIDILEEKIKILER